MPRIRVLLVDDHPAVRRGLRHLLATRRDMAVVGEAEDADGAVRAAADLAPDAVVLDVHLGSDNGFDVALRLRQMLPAPHIVMLTSAGLDDAHARAAGDFVCLLKADADEHLAAAIRAAFD